MTSRGYGLRSYVLLICCLCVAIGVAPVAASPSANVEAKLQSTKITRPTPRRTRSTGYAWDGQLIRGKRVRESKFLRYLPEDAASGRFYGTSQMVQLLERAARRVATRYPGAKLSIGELSSARGGDIDGHRSHESGRDADIGFYVKGPNGRPFAYRAFVTFTASGRGTGAHSDLRFDDARNWELVAKLVSDPDARVQYIFVARTIKNRLLRQAVRRKAPAQVIERAQAVLVQPARGNPHRSHFHVRIYCAPSDRPTCRDVAPFWAWYPGNRPLGPTSEHAAATTAARSRKTQL